LINYSQLIKPDYIDSAQGSSLSGLMQAAKDYGIYAEPMAKLNIEVLRNCPYPVILHVKKEGYSKKYDHYQLFLGIEDDKIRLFDPPNPVEVIPYYELAPLWDGTGLIVSAEPINLAKIFAPARKRFAIFAAIIIATIVIVKIAGKYLSRKVGNINKPVLMTFSVAQSAGLVIVALLIGVVYHFANDEGFLAHAGATESVVKTNLASFIPKVSAKDIKSVSGSAVIIDARQTPDYDAGHIDGAINIPTTLCAAGRTAKLAEVAKNSRLIIYCQSAGCPYAEKVAANLMEDGFNNLAIYKGGWVDWDKRKK